MPSVLMGVGDFRFGVSTAAYESIRRQTEWRWGQVERIGRSPALQYLGPGGDIVTLQGVVYPHYRGGLAQVEAMRKEAAKGAPLTVVSGRGDAMGRWCIVSVEESGGVLFQDGSARKIEFTVTLKAYGEDEAGGSESIVNVPGVGNALSGGLANAVSGGGAFVSAVSAASVPFGEALAAVEIIASEIEDVGLLLVEAAEAVVSMADEVAAVASGLVTDLAATVLTPVLDMIGVAEAELAALAGTDVLRAVGTVVDAANALTPALREEAFEIVFGPETAARAIKVASAVEMAASNGKRWLA